MASGMPPVKAEITRTVTSGYDWTVSARKLVKHAALTLGSVALYAVAQWAMNPENVKTLVGDSPLALLAVPLIAGLAGAGVNWLKHRDDVPAQVTVVPLPVLPDVK